MLNVSNNGVIHRFKAFQPTGVAALVGFFFRKVLSLVHTFILLNYFE